LHPDDVIGIALWAHIRRVVYDAESVVIDMGRRSRLFTGSAREAALILAEQCEWTGCEIPPEWCQGVHAADGSAAAPWCKPMGDVVAVATTG
jgi:hypothetical protein